MLAAHLSEHDAGDLVSAAAHQSGAAIGHLPAHRFPRPDVATSLRAI